MAPIRPSRARSLTIGGLSRLTGVNIETIRYYERINLLTNPPRTAGGQRSYQLEHVERLRFIRRARKLGFSIDTIRTLLTLAIPGSNSCSEAREIAVIHLADVRIKRNDLAKLEEVLAASIQQCETQCCGTSPPPCPVFAILQA